MPKPRVLVVDDQPNSAYLLAAMAATAGDVQIATQSADAVRIAEEWRPDIVLLDLLMPDPNGFEVARQLRANLPEIKIVAVSAVPRDDHRVQDAGFDRYLVKPVLKDSVIQVIRQLAP